NGDRRQRWYAPSRHVLGNRRGSSYSGIAAGGPPGQHSTVGTGPHIIADNNSSRAHIRSSCGFNTVIQCSKHRIMPDEAIVPDFYTTLILEPTATINEYAVTKRNVFTEI